MIINLNSNNKSLNKLINIIIKGKIIKNIPVQSVVTTDSTFINLNFIMRNMQSKLKNKNN